MFIPEIRDYLYSIINLRSGKKIKPESYEEDAKIVLAPVEDDTNWTKWSKEYTDDEHYYLKNAETGMYFRPVDLSIGALMKQEPMTVDTILGQWSGIPGTEEGYVYLVNRETGNFIRPTGHDSDGLPVKQVGSGMRGRYTQWTFIPDAISVAVTGVSVTDCPSVELDEGAMHQLSAEVSPADANDQSVSWSSSNTGVAAVDAYGIVSAVAAGTTNITVKTSDGGFTATCALTVVAPTITVTTNDGGFTAECSITVGASTTVRQLDGSEQFVELFPNPASDVIYLRFSESASEKAISIFNTHGQLLFSKNTYNSKTQIDIRQFNSEGMLIVKVISGGITASFKVIKD